MILSRIVEYTLYLTEKDGDPKTNFRYAETVGDYFRQLIGMN